MPSAFHKATLALDIAGLDIAGQLLRGRKEGNDAELAKVSAKAGGAEDAKRGKPAAAPLPQPVPAKYPSKSRADKAGQSKGKGAPSPPPPSSDSA